MKVLGTFSLKKPKGKKKELSGAVLCAKEC